MISLQFLNNFKFLFQFYCSFNKVYFKVGGMAERFMAHAWKACWGSRPSGVQIPLPPPLN